MKQFILSKAPEAGGRVRISGKDHHYLVHVRRLAPGAVFNALLPTGSGVRIRVLAVDKICLIGECIDPPLSVEAPVPPGPASPRVLPGDLPPIYLFQALPKGVKMDMIVRQAAEGGVTGVIPFFSAHGVPRLSSGKGEERLARWQRIVKEARQQSGSGIPTQVEAPLDIEGLLARWEELRRSYSRPLGLLLHQDPLEQGTFHSYLSRGLDMAAALIGPEGGFSQEETARFKAAGFKPLVMGDTVLRVETAALYTMAVIRIILWERMWWMPKTP